jgi:hypothetical protein
MVVSAGTSRKTTGNKVLYIPKPTTPNTSYKQVGPSPEQQKKNNPVVSVLINKPENVAQQQKVAAISTMNYGQARLESGLSQQLYDAGGVANYINLQTKQAPVPTKIAPAPKTSKFDQGFTTESKSLGYKTMGTAELARKIDVKNINNPNYTPELRAELNQNLQKYPEWFDPQSQTVQQADARRRESNAAYIAKVNYQPPTILQFEGTQSTKKLSPSQQKRYEQDKLNLIAVERPSGKIALMKSTESADRLYVNQITEYPRPAGFGIVPKEENIPIITMDSIAKQSKNNINEIMPFTTFESTGARSNTQKAKTRTSQPVIEELFGEGRLNPINPSGTIAERIASGLAIGAAGEFEEFGNIPLSVGKELGSPYLPYKERESAGTIGTKGFLGSILEGGWEILNSPFRTPEENLKKFSEVNQRALASQTRVKELIEADPWTQIPTFVAPIVSFIPETVAKVGLKTGGAVTSGAIGILKKTTPQIIQTPVSKAATTIKKASARAKNNLLDNIFVSYGTKSMREQKPSSINYGEIIQPITVTAKTTGKTVNKRAPKQTDVFIATTQTGRSFAEESARRPTTLGQAKSDVGITASNTRGRKLIDMLTDSGKKVDDEDMRFAREMDKYDIEKELKYKLANDPFPRTAGSITDDELSMNMAQIAKGTRDPAVVKLQRDFGKRKALTISYEDAEKLYKSNISLDDYMSYVYPKTLNKSRKTTTDFIDDYLDTLPSKSKKGFNPLGEEITFSGKKKPNYFYAEKKSGGKVSVVKKPKKGGKYYEVPEVKGSGTKQIFADDMLDSSKKGKSTFDDLFNTGGKITKGARRIYNSDYIFPIIGGAAVGVGYGISKLFPPSQKPVTDKQKEKIKQPQIFAFDEAYLTGYRDELKNKRNQREKQNPFFGLIQTPYLDQDQPQIVDQTPKLGTRQRPVLDQIYETSFPPYDPTTEVPIQAPFLDQVPYRGRITPVEYLFAPNTYNLFSNTGFSIGEDLGGDNKFFRVFAAAKEPFGKTELPLGEYVDSSAPIFEIRDRLSGKQIRKQNRIGGLQNPLRAPKNIIDEDNFMNLFGYGQPVKKKQKRTNNTFGYF